MVLVTGATSAIGSELSRLLGQAGVPFRATYRRANDYTRLADLGAEPFSVDLGSVESLKRALDGCEQLFLLRPPSQDQIQFERNAVSAARAMGLVHVVKLSAGDASLTSQIPWAMSHAVSEQNLRKGSFTNTVLRASTFMQNLLQLAGPIKRGLLPLPAGSTALSWVHAHDMAAVAARVLKEKGHEGRTYFITGPHALTMAETARKFSNALHRKVRYIDLPKWAYRASLLGAGLDRWTAKGLATQFGNLARGSYDIAVTQDIETICRTPARTLEAFIEEHRAAFLD